jgi:hypothetical protein
MPPLASSRPLAEPLNDESVGSVNADHLERFVAGGGKAVRRCRLDHDDVAGAGDDLFASDDHGRVTREDDASLGVWMPMQRRAFARRKDPLKEGNTGAVGLTLERDLGDFATALISRMKDVEHSSSRLYACGGGGAGVRP